MPKKIAPEPIEKVLLNMEMSTDQFVMAIGRISDGMKVLAKSQLKEEAIYFLVSRSSGVGVGDVKRVLEGIASLDRKYLKPSKK